MKPFASYRLALDFSTLYYVSLRTPIHVVNTQLCESCPSKNYNLLLRARRFFFSFLMDLKKIKWDGFRNQYIYFGNFPHPLLHDLKNVGCNFLCCFHFFSYIYIYIYIYEKKWKQHRKLQPTFFKSCKSGWGKFPKSRPLAFFCIAWSYLMLSHLAPGNFVRLLLRI
jgi:hypothetical protein